VKPRLRRASPLVAVIWLCFTAKLVFYASAMPVWEGYDESSHFDFVEYLATVGRLPDVRFATGSRAVADSLRLAPVPWTLRGERPGEISQDEFWRLPLPERMARVSEVRAIRGDSVPDRERRGLPLYEAQQPPLAYLVLLPVFLAFRHSSLLTQSWALRIAGSLIASAVIPVAFLVGRRVFRNDWRAAGLAGVIAALPELPLLIGHAGNEPLSLLAGAACVYLLVGSTSTDTPLLWSFMTGLFLGCALLTKAYFLALIPPALVIGLVMWRRKRDLRRIIALALPPVVAVLMAGWWYVRNWSISGTFTGQMTEVAARGAGVSMLQAALRANWLHAADFALTSHLWLGGWSFLVLRAWMYKGFAVLLFAAFAGMVVLATWKRRAPGAFEKLICGGLALFFWIVPAYHALANYRISGNAETMGYYTYSVVVAEGVWLIAGIAVLLPKLATRFVAPALNTSFAALEAYGLIFVLLPYYGGFTFHTASGSVPALHLGQLAGGGLERLFGNLALCKPEFLSSPVLQGMFVCYLVALFGIVAIGFILARREKSACNLAP
jgi:hypothetical protein